MLYNNSITGFKSFRELELLFLLLFSIKRLLKVFIPLGACPFRSSLITSATNLVVIVRLSFSRGAPEIFASTQLNPIPTLQSSWDFLLTSAFWAEGLKG
jgi:hypothetical protein